MDHPAIVLMERKGEIDLQKMLCIDALGNEVFEGDEIFEHNDEVFLIETLGHEAKEILEIIGANKKIAH